jgi:hypothetical protein
MFDEPEKVAVLLFLLYMDPFTTSDLRREISSAFDDFIASISNKAETRHSVSSFSVFTVYLMKTIGTHYMSEVINYCLIISPDGGNKASGYGIWWTSSLSETETVARLRAYDTKYQHLPRLGEYLIYV